jgi:pyrimidine deaminase RibD-like protein
VLVAAIAAVAVSVAVAGLYLTAAVARGQAGARCTHGVSSVGPVFLRDGKIVGGDTTPHTEACLP